jgi:hypothetical protein
MFFIFNLSEKQIAKVGSMDLCVAQCARLLLGCILSIHNRETIRRAARSEMGNGVALQAKQVHIAEFQHVNIRSAVWDMASAASLRPHGSMLEHEGSLLVGVAFVADGIAGVWRSDLPHHMIGLPNPIGSVLIMTITALDQSFQDTMTEGHIELGLLL